LKFVLPILWLLGMFGATNVFAPPVSPLSEEIKPIILTGIEYTINNRFEEAFKIFAKLIEEYPQEPLGYFYYAAALQSQLLDGEDYSLVPEFEKYIQLSLEKAQAVHQRRPGDPWAYFYEGNAYLYRAFVKGKQRHWWGAYQDSRRGASRLKKALELDSTLYEAYLGLGSFKYWKSSKAKFLSFLPLFKDEREIGIRMVRLSVEKGELVRWIARDQLAWILIDAGDLPGAFQLAKRNLEEFPDSRFFLWTLAEVYYRSGNYEEAFRAYSHILAQIRQNPNNNHLNELTCLFRMAKSKFALSQVKEARDLLEEALQIPIAPQLRKQAKSRIKRILNLKVRSDEILESQKTER